MNGSSSRGEEPSRVLRLAAGTQLALKAALDVAGTELRQEIAPSAPVEPEFLASLTCRAAEWAEAPPPVRISLTQSEAVTLAHYVELAMRMRGYVVGRPEANQRFVDLYRVLTKPQGRGKTLWQTLRQLWGGENERC